MSVLKKLQKSLSSNFPVRNTLYEFFPWTSIFYVKRRYSHWKFFDIVKLWIQSTPPKEHKPGSIDAMFGWEDKPTRAGEFFTRLAHEEQEAAKSYPCAYGCCIVLWHPKRGNIGGSGIPECPCQELKDPRDLSKGAL